MLEEEEETELALSLFRTSPSGQRAYVGQAQIPLLVTDGGEFEGECGVTVKWIKFDTNEGEEGQDVLIRVTRGSGVSLRGELEMVSLGQMWKVARLEVCDRLVKNVQATRDAEERYEKV